jgi:hypothetical protein
VKEAVPLSEAMRILECGGIVICEVPSRYPMALKFGSGNHLLERCHGSWYTCRKGAATILSATKWFIESETDDDAPHFCGLYKQRPLTIDERLSRLERKMQELI